MLFHYQKNITQITSTLIQVLDLSYCNKLVVSIGKVGCFRVPAWRPFQKNIRLREEFKIKKQRI